jgi:tyrosyl-tRNA synthetase
MKIVTDEAKIDELLTRGVDKIYPSNEELKKALLSGKKLKLYQGFDPTGSKLHIGHMVGLRKLAQWQKLGHHVIFLIGDGTGQAGDPSGKTTARDKFHTREELRQNAKDYVMQAKNIVDFGGDNPVEILYNGDWLNELKLVDVLNIAENFSLQQLSERDLFKERMKKGETVNLREFLYPLLQAYDSVAMDVDVELGGSDQTFNMLAGRTLIKAMKNKEKFVMTLPLLADKSGKKIGKTEGNSIALDDKPEDLFGKIMAFPDEVIVRCFECLTTVPILKIEAVKKAIGEGDNPMVYKKELAEQIVKELSGESASLTAALSWSNTFQKGETPEEIEEFMANSGESLGEVLVKNKIVSSKSEWRRLVEGGGAHDLEGSHTITDANQKIEKELTLKIGKKKFVKIKVS